MHPSKTHERRWWTLAGLCVSLLVVGLDNTILNVALPTLARELGASTSQLQWIVDSYVLVFAGLLLVAGSLGDRFGRHRALQVGLVLFGGGSVLASFVDSPGELIATRASMGVGAALIMPATLSILMSSFRDERERARAISIWAGFSAIGVAVGPIAGGWLLERFSWHSVFVVNVPVVVAALVLGRFVVPPSRDPAAGRLDLVGAALSVLGLVALVYAVIEAPHHGWGSPETIATFALATAVLAAFVTWELRVAEPMLDVRFFRNRRFTAASVSITLAFFALFGGMFFLAQYLQFVLAYSALEAGVRMLPLAGAMFVSAPFSARLVERIGTKLVVAGGMVTIATGLLLISFLTAGTPYALVAGATAVMGLGIGLALAPATESVMGALPPEKAGVGSAMNDTTREVGGALGVAVLGSVLSSTYGPALIDGLGDGAAALPPDVEHTLRTHVGAAFALAERLGGGAADALVGAARAAFVDAMGLSLLAAAGVALLGAVVAAVWLPARAGARPAERSGADEGADVSSDVSSDGSSDGTSGGGDEVATAGGRAAA